jgi:hypothetical protein
MNRKHATLLRRVARLIGSWRDVHEEQSLSASDHVRNIDVGEDGEVKITIKPSRPHCPCCLLDLDLMRKEISNVKGITWVEFDIVEVPDAERWMQVLNR